MTVVAKRILNKTEWDRPHPASPKGRLRKYLIFWDIRRGMPRLYKRGWIIDKILTWWVMVSAFDFAVAFSNFAVDWFVGTVIEV